MTYRSSSRNGEIDSGLGCVLALLSLPLLIVVGAVANGLVLSQLWDWFVVETFNVPGINAFQAIGISLIAGMLTKGSTSRESDEEEHSVWYSLSLAFALAIVSPLFALFVGWTIYQFV